MVCLSIRIIERVRFDGGSLAPSARSVATMQAAADVMKDNPKVQLMLEGHRDASEKDYSRRVGLRRARAVKQFLVAEGIDPTRVCTMGFGDSRPLTRGQSAEERAANRRVEFRIMQAGEVCRE